MGARRKGRIIAFQSLYSYDLSDGTVEDISGFSWIDPEKREQLNEKIVSFARLIVCGTIENLSTIDSCIQEQLEHWDFSRLNRVDLAILRISVYCLLYQKQIPASVTIDEAIDISKEYGTDDSYRFINGVLDGINKRLEL